MFLITGQVFWVCRRCDDKNTVYTIYDARSISSAIEHLRNKHKIVGELTPDTSESDDMVPLAKRQKIAPIITKSQVQAAQELALGFILNTDQPFAVFEDEYLHNLLYRLDWALTNQVLWSRQSQCNQLRTIY